MQPIATRDRVDCGRRKRPLPARADCRQSPGGRLRCVEWTPHATGSTLKSVSVDHRGCCILCLSSSCTVRMSLPSSRRCVARHPLGQSCLPSRPATQLCRIERCCGRTERLGFARGAGLRGGKGSATHYVDPCALHAVASVNGLGPQ